MYEIIVVDDELMIRKGISSFINNTSSDFQVSYTFKDGEEAIDFLQDHTVDLIISDIKMVHKSGIDLAKYVYENRPEVKVVLLSGYKEFEYARAAIRYNVKNYISKPTDFGELRNVLNDIKEELDKTSVNHVDQFFDRVKQLYADIVAGKRQEVVDEVKSLLESNLHNGTNLGQYAYNLFDTIFNKLFSDLKIQLTGDKFDYDTLPSLKTPHEVQASALRLAENILDALSHTDQDSNDMLLSKIKQYIDEHFGEDLSLQDVAEKAFLSTVYFSRFFKKQTGENFSDYLLRVRMEHAAQYLKENKKVTDVSQACGYSNSGYFSRIFKEYYGCTPTEYTRQASFNG